MPPYTVLTYHFIVGSADLGTVHEEDGCCHSLPFHMVATHRNSGARKSRPCVTRSVQHVVVHCVKHKAPDGFAGLRRLDAATRTSLKELNIDI